MEGASLNANSASPSLSFSQGFATQFACLGKDMRKKDP